MKILFGGALTLFIRKEDFTKIDIDQNLISYTRPNGTQALIKFKYTINSRIKSRSSRSTQALFCHKMARKDPCSRARVLKPQGLIRKIVRFTVQMKFKTLERKLSELETKVHALNRSFNQLSTQTSVLMDKKIRGLEQSINPSQTLKISKYSTIIKELQERVTNLDKVRLPEIRNTWKLNEDKLDRTFAEPFARIEILKEKMNTAKAVETSEIAHSNNPNMNTSEPT